MNIDFVHKWESLLDWNILLKYFNITFLLSFVKCRIIPMVVLSGSGEILYENVGVLQIHEMGGDDLAGLEDLYVYIYWLGCF